MDNKTDKWPSRIVILRHAESEGNARRAYLEQRGSTEIELGLGKRDADFELTERGREQARATGRGLNELGAFDVAYVSPYVRTRQTAEMVSEKLSMRPPQVIEERIREKEFGVLESLTYHGRGVRFPEEVERRQKVGKYYYRPPGGESYPDVNLRVHSLLGTLIREYAGRQVLVVTHAAVVLCFRRLLERFDEAELLEIDKRNDVKNAGVLAYEFGERKPGERLAPMMYNHTYWES
jgi:broad specificity phosphatase PhoE